MGKPNKPYYNVFFLLLLLSELCINQFIIIRIVTFFFKLIHTCVLVDWSKIFIDGGVVVVVWWMEQLGTIVCLLLFLLLIVFLNGQLCVCVCVCSHYNSTEWKISVSVRMKHESQKKMNRRHKILEQNQLHFKIFILSSVSGRFYRMTKCVCFACSLLSHSLPLYS